MVRITKQEFTLLSDYIRAHYGIHLKEEKETLMAGRLHQVLDQQGFLSFTEYYNHLVADTSGSAVTALADKITTNHTFFMREADHFHFFRETVLPYLEKTVRDRDLRIWCAGCSTGEEPYTLAMIMDEYFGAEKPLWDTRILATDISDRVLAISRKGIYDRARVEPLPPQWKMNYFKKMDSQSYAISEKMKREVFFRKFNLIDPFSLFKKKFHVIFCRNVMIYFDNDTKDRLADKMYDVTEQGGYFFIGHSESLGRGKSPFRYVKPAVYRKE